MKKYYIAALIMAVALLGASQLSAQTSASFVLLTPSNGDILRGGQRVLITWNLSLDKTITEHPFGEMEFFLQTDEGVNMRITPQLSLHANTFSWTVPNIRSRSAWLTVRCGIEGEGDQYYFAQTGTFSIRSSRRAAELMLNAMPESMKPGSEMEISWTSNLYGNSSYDVMVSYDRGAHFHKAGSTTETRYALQIDEDFAGAITVQIVGNANGSKVRSLLTRDATVLVGDKGNR